jgi:hypothetical protein
MPLFDYKSVRQVAVLTALLGASTFIAACNRGPTSPTPRQEARTFLRFSSESGDWIGAGRAREYGLQDGTWTTEYWVPYPGVQLITIRLEGLSDELSSSWTLDLAAATGQPLVPGTYEGTRRYPFSYPDNGLNFRSSGRQCNDSTGRFTIESISGVPGGELDRLQATFEQQCDGAAAVLRGRVSIVANPWR